MKFGGRNSAYVNRQREHKERHESVVQLTSPEVPGLLLVVRSPVPSSFRARRNSLLRSGPRRISFSLDGAMSMGGVVLEGCCRGREQKKREFIKSYFKTLNDHLRNPLGQNRNVGCVLQSTSIESDMFLHRVRAGRRQGLSHHRSLN